VVGNVPQDRDYAGERTYCVIGDRTIIREGASVHRGTGAETSTIIGNDCMLMATAHVGHNCRLGEGVIVTNGSMLGGHVSVGDGANVSGRVAVHQFVRVGELVMIAGLTRLTMDVPPYFLCSGDSTCVGINAVGLRRAGMPADQIQDVKQAYRILYRSGLPFREAVARLGERVTTDAGRRIIAFVRAESKRGYCAGARRRN
jgi:UDP-N-acetylglucosamine acyltransferase